MLKEHVVLTTIYFHMRILQNANKHWKLHAGTPHEGHAAAAQLRNNGRDMDDWCRGFSP